MNDLSSANSLNTDEMMDDMAFGQSFVAPIGADARLDLLDDMLAAFVAPNQFCVGDKVTPRNDSGLRAHGEPHLVVEIDQVGFRDYSGESSQSDFGELLNVRIAKVVQEGEDYSICLYWVEGHRLEPYTAAHHPAYTETLAVTAARLAELKGCLPVPLTRW